MMDIILNIEFVLRHIR